MTTPTRNLEAEVAAIKAQHDAATRNRVRAEQARDTAEAQAAALRTQLKSEFGVTDLDEGEAHLATLEAQLAECIARLRQQLTEAGGSVR